MKSENWQDSLAALRSAMVPTEPEPEQPVPAEATAPKQTGRLDIVLDRKRRAGKTATIIAGFTLPDSEVAALATEMKRRLGTGGSARGGEILIQGDRRYDAEDFLKARGFKCRII